MDSPQLHIKSRKAPAPEGFISHSSPLEQLPNSPFLVHLTEGRVQSTFIPLNEPLSIVNLKKGIASLFQFHLQDQTINETDASGSCLVTYKKLSPTAFQKTKKNCKSSDDTPHLIHPDDLFSITIDSIRNSKYEMKQDLSCIESLRSSESHEMTVNIRKDAGSKLTSIQELTLLDTSSASSITEENLEKVIQKLSEDLSLRFTEESLVTEREPKMCQDSECPNLEKVVSENMGNILEGNFGKVKGATGFLRILEAARRAKKEVIYKVMTMKKYKDIL